VLWQSHQVFTTKLKPLLSELKQKHLKIAKEGQIDQTKPVLLTRPNRFRLTTLNRNILSIETMLRLILAQL